MSLRKLVISFKNSLFMIHLDECHYQRHVNIFGSQCTKSQRINESWMYLYNNMNIVYNLHQIDWLINYQYFIMFWVQTNWNFIIHHDRFERLSVWIKEEKRFSSGHWFGMTIIVTIKVLQLSCLLFYNNWSITSVCSLFVCCCGSAEESVE